MFYNPTGKEAITVTAQLQEDIDGVYRKISAYPDDITWRQYFVRRSLAQFDVHGVHDMEPVYPELMTARQVAGYLGFEEKTIRNWTSKGTIPYKKVGGSPRYLKSEIDDALKRGVLGSKKSMESGKTKKVKT